MKTIMLSVNSGIQSPSANPFKIFACESIPSGIPEVWHVDSGVEIKMPVEVRLHLEPMSGVYILCHTLTDSGRLRFLVSGKFELGDCVAMGWIVERNVVQVRFMEKGSQGGRIIRGEPRQVENCTENRIS